MPGTEENHRAPKRKALTRQDKDSMVEKVIAANFIHESYEIETIAKIRGWVSGGWFATAVVKKYLSGRMTLDRAADGLASRIDRCYTTANGGRALVRAEEEARYHRSKDCLICSGNVFEYWGREEDVSKFEVTDARDAPTVEGQLWSLWYAILYASRTIPWHRQKKLLDLVRAFKARPDPPPPANVTRALRADCIWTEDNLWSSLRLFNPSARQAANDRPGDNSGWYDPEVHAYENIQGFKAQLTAAGIHDFTFYAAVAFALALQEDTTSPDSDLRRTPPEKQTEVHFSSAYIWLQMAGQYLYDHRDVSADDAEAVYLDSRGSQVPWRRTDTRLTLVRWTYWRLRFEQEAAKDTNTEVAREIAKKSAALMRQIAS